MSEEQQEYRIEGRPATIFRTVKSKDNPFVMIDRRPIDNAALSFKAKGILTYLMSRPDGWEVSVKDLFNHATDGEDAIRSGLAELRKAGHMKYVQERVKGRITGMVIEVYEVPLTSPHADFPDVEKPHVEKPDVENPTQVISTLSSTESSSKEREPALSQKDFYGMTAKDAQQVLELQRFRDATGTWPGVGQWWMIYQRMNADALTVEQVRNIFEQWCARGYKPNNIDFLLYAKAGNIPDNNKKVTYGKPNPNSKSEPPAPVTDAQRAAVERIRAQRLAAAAAQVVPV